jgi:hypothetical protein
MSGWHKMTRVNISNKFPHKGVHRRRENKMNSQLKKTSETMLSNALMQNASSTAISTKRTA